MNKNVKIAKELIKIAKQLVAAGYQSPLGRWSTSSNSVLADIIKDYQAEASQVYGYLQHMVNTFNAESASSSPFDWKDNKVYFKAKVSEYTNEDTSALMKKVETYEQEQKANWRIVHYADENDTIGKTIAWVDNSKNKTEMERLDALEQALLEQGIKIPDDCDLYADGNEYVVSHDDGWNEYSMFYSPNLKGKTYSVSKEDLKKLSFHMVLNLTPVGLYNNANRTVEKLAPSYNLTISTIFDCETGKLHGYLILGASNSNRPLGDFGNGAKDFNIDYFKDSHETLNDVVERTFNELVDYLCSGKKRYASVHEKSLAFVAKKILNVFNKIKK